MLRLLVVLFLPLVFLSELKGQVSDISPKDSVLILHLKKASSNHAEYRKNLVNNYQKKGYLLAVADSMAPDQIRISPGIYFDSIAVVWDDWQGSRSYNSTASGLLNDMEWWLQETENTGYPFSEINLQLLAQKAQRLTIKATAIRGEKYFLDTLIFRGFELSKTFLKWSAGIKMGMPYNHKSVKLLQQKLASVDGFAVLGEPMLQALDGRMLVYLPVEKPLRDQLSGLVGLATVPNGRPVFTGEAMGKFYNMFQSGVYGAFEWRSFKARSQELRLGVSLPYLFSVPFNTRLQLAYEKYDTIYSAFTRSAQLKLPMGKRSGLLIGASFTDRYRIFSDLSQVTLFHQLPDNPPSRNSLYQLGFEYNNLVPGKLNIRGLEIITNAGIGTRRFVRDPQVTAITWINSAGNAENIYDSLERVGQFRITRYRLALKLSWYVPIRRWLVLKTGFDGVNYQAPRIYFNELERFGGIKNLRGFNEQSIFASEFYMGTVELRFVSGNAGYLAPFYHFGWFKDGSKTTSPGSGYLQGMGIQTAFRTAAGILNLAWALGKSGAQPLGLNQSRFHIGISSAF